MVLTSDKASYRPSFLIFIAVEKLFTRTKEGEEGTEAEEQ